MSHSLNKELIKSIQNSLILATNKIRLLKEQTGDPIGTQDHITDDDMLVFELEQQIEKLQVINK